MDRYREEIESRLPILLSYYLRIIYHEMNQNRLEYAGRKEIRCSFVHCSVTHNPDIDAYRTASQDTTFRISNIQLQ
jgi:hypothetical protein